MEKSTHTPLYDHFRAKLVEMRHEAGLTQRELAERLGREHSFVSRLELGDRRVDLVEFFWICKACDASPEAVAGDLIREFRKIERREKRRR
jgi:transcriptional regulator with XRE-family HTH domain